MTMAMRASFRLRKSGAPQDWNFSVFGSNLTSEPCIMLPIQTIPSRSNRMSRLPVGAPGFVIGNGIFGRLAGLGVEPAHILRAEIPVPDHSARIHLRVMRHRDRPRQVILGDDHARRFARGPRIGLQRVWPLVRRSG